MTGEGAALVPGLPAGLRRGWIRFVLLALITAAIFYLLFRQSDFDKVVQSLRRADRGLLALSFSFTALMPVFSALRWRRMLLALGHRVPFRRCFDMIMAAWPMGTITPSKSGDLVRAYYLKDRVPATLVVGNVLAERLVDVLVLLALALSGSLAFRRWGLAALSGGVLALGLVLVYLLLRFRLPVPARFADKVEPMLRSLRLLTRSRTLLGVVVAYTVINWFVSIFQLVFAYLALGVRVPLLFAAGALPLAVFVGLLPLTISGMGTRDSALILLFAPLAPADVSLGAGILYTLFGYWLPSLVGLLFLRRVMPRRSGPRLP